MKHHAKRLFAGLLTLALALSICLTPVSALTADQLKELLQEIYIDEVDEVVLSQDNIADILEALGDPYTRYMTPEEFEEFLGSMEDEEISGIGISAAAADEGFVIVAVYEGLSADKAGLVPGDIITAVDGQSAVGVPAAEVSGWLRGELGATVTITVKRQNGSVRDYTLKRVLVVIPKTTAEQIANIGYISCQAFGDETLGHFQKALAEKPEPDVWVVDLRNNGGGSVDAAVQTLGLFLGTGLITFLRNDKGENIAYYVSTQKVQTMRPVIVLTSPWTASAAELFSSVIRDAQAGLVIGEITYGKGVAQLMLTAEDFPDLFPDGDAMTITAARYYTTKGNTADRIGVIPHLLVDAQIAGDISLLLSGQETSKGDLLRFTLGNWRWIVELDFATAPEVLPYFTALLEALPPGVAMSLRKNNAWAGITMADLVRAYGVTDYVSRAFTDVGSGKRADKINTLACYDILKGYGNGEFRPEGSMTRAEFCSLLVQGLGLTGSGKMPFADVQEDDWYYEAVSAAYDAGLMNGIGDGQFAPEGMVSQEQMITVLGRAAVNLNASLSVISEEYDPAAATVTAGYSDWAKPWVWLLSESLTSYNDNTINLLHSSPTAIDPGANASRGDTAEVLYNILQCLGVLTV